MWTIIDGSRRPCVRRSLSRLARPLISSATERDYDSEVFLFLVSPRSFVNTRRFERCRYIRELSSSLVVNLTLLVMRDCSGPKKLILPITVFPHSSPDLLRTSYIYVRFSVYMCVCFEYALAMYSPNYKRRLLIISILIENTAALCKFFQTLYLTVII